MLRASRLVWMLVEKITAAETPRGRVSIVQGVLRKADSPPLVWSNHQPHGQLTAFLAHLQSQHLPKVSVISTW